MLTDANGSSASDRNRANAAEQNAAAAPQTNASGSAEGNSVASAGSVLIQMFFLVSLVANVYLVFLIRKLLHRYRSLLTTVRSQTA
jgi:hypothetical protein